MNLPTGKTLVFSILGTISKSSVSFQCPFKTIQNGVPSKNGFEPDQRKRHRPCGFRDSGARAVGRTCQRLESSSSRVVRTRKGTPSKQLGGVHVGFVFFGNRTGILFHKTYPDGISSAKGDRPFAQGKNILSCIAGICV